MFNQFKAWMHGQRSSTRLAFVLQVAVRILFSLLSLVWTPLLLHSMGKSLNGVFLIFQKMTSLGGLGDLGMGGAVNIRTSRLLGQGREDELRNFLSAARGIFLVMAVVAAGVFWVVSPHLFKVLEFGSEPQTGFWPMLSLVGGVSIAFVVLNSYINNLNYGCANLVLPIVPTFVVMQLAFLCHWLLARQHTVLWVQYIPYLVGAALLYVMGWFYLKTSHPSLATLLPLKFSRKQFVDLFGSSFWYYLAVVGTGIWISTDMLLITARFGPEIIPTYQYNYRLCELAAFVINSANLAGMSKIAMWIASPEAVTRSRGVQELMRLGRFQTFLGCSAALVYLNVNDWFMGLWLGPDYQAPFLWQIAFATSVAVAGGGQMVCSLTPRCANNGLRVGGIVSLLAALLNLGLSFAAMNLSSVIGMNFSIFGIALATVISQSSRDLFLGRYAAQQLSISWWRLNVKNWLLALATIVFGAVIRTGVPLRGAQDVSLAIAIHAVWLLIVARLAGISLKDLQQEKLMFQAMFHIKK